MDGKVASWAASWGASWGVAAVSGGLIVSVMAAAFWWRGQVAAPALAPQVGNAPPVETAAAPPRRTGLATLPPKTPTPPAAPAPAAEATRVDIVRVLPNGDVVVAGRAQPGAHVALLDNGQTLMETRADPATGEFVFLPPRLAAGQHQLALKEEGPAPGSQSPQRDLTAFAIAPQIRREPQPIASAAAPAAIPAVAPSEAARMAKTIARGDTLWRISREMLGRGALYDSIVQANSGKIRNPNLIYPGQSLDIPHHD
jgi:hypothetical protein